MKFLLVILSLLLPIVSQAGQAADSREERVAAKDIERLPFDGVVPLPGALAVSGNGHIAAHIGSNGDIVIWRVVDAKVLDVVEAKEKSGDLPTVGRLIYQLQAIPSDHEKPSAIALNADGSLVAIGYLDSRWIVWSRPEKRSLREFHGHLGGIVTLTFSPDGQRLASGGEDGTTQLWNIVTGRRLRIFDSKDSDEGNGGIPVSIGFSGDGRTLVVNEWLNRRYDEGRSTTIWDIDEDVEIATEEVAPPNDGRGMMRAGQALGGQGWLLVFTNSDGLMVKRLDRCGPPQQLPSGRYAQAIAADPLGRWVAVTEYSEIAFFGMNNDPKSHTITLPAKFLVLALQTDGRSVFVLMISDPLILGGDAEMAAIYRIPVPASLWNLPPLYVKNAARCAFARSQEDLKLPENPLELAIIVRFAPTEAMIPDPDKFAEGERQIDPVGELYFDKRGNLHTLYQEEEMFPFRVGVAVWDMQTKRLKRGRFNQHIGGSILRLTNGWGVVEKTVTNLLTGESFPVSDGYAAPISDPDTGVVYRLAEKQFQRYGSEGQSLPDLEVNGTVQSFTARNGRLATLDRNGNIQIWQFEPRGESKTYKLLNGNSDDWEWHRLSALSADGRYLLVVFESPSGDAPDTYSMYRLSSGEQVGDGALLAPFPGRSNRGVVKDTRPHRLAVWDYDKGKIIARLPRQRSRDKDGGYAPLRAAISDDGRLVAGASYDGLVRVWDIDAHRLVGQGRAGGEVTAIAFDPTGQQLAAGKKDGGIVVFEIPATSQ
jgi:WD40 repeat protein